MDSKNTPSASKTKSVAKPPDSSKDEDTGEKEKNIAAKKIMGSLKSETKINKININDRSKVDDKKNINSSTIEKIKSTNLAENNARMMTAEDGEKDLGQDEEFNPNPIIHAGVLTGVAFNGQPPPVGSEGDGQGSEVSETAPSDDVSRRFSPDPNPNNEFVQNPMGFAGVSPDGRPIPLETIGAEPANFREWVSSPNYAATKLYYKQ